MAGRRLRRAHRIQRDADDREPRQVLLPQPHRLGRVGLSLDTGIHPLLKRVELQHPRVLAQLQVRERWRQLRELQVPHARARKVGADLRPDPPLEPRVVGLERPERAATAERLERRASKECHDAVLTTSDVEEKYVPHTHKPRHTLSAAPGVRSRANPQRRSNCSRSRRACPIDSLTEASVTLPDATAASAAPAPLSPTKADVKPPLPARSATAERARMSIAETSSIRRLRKALIFSRT